ncbi:MAG: hypothetical protein NXI31_16150 [bacterium]|nr:hypothetical protein [bacterium]
MKRQLSVFFSALGLVASAVGQCTPLWPASDVAPGASDWVAASTMWDPDGAGPQPPVLVVGGAFHAVGDVAAQKIAAYDLATGTWSSLGSGMNRISVVHALATMANGDLVAAGTFTSAGGQRVFRIARWNGSSWSPIGPATGQNSPTVYALLTLSNGDLIAGGTFQTFGGVVARRIARWDGTAWSEVGGGVRSGGASFVQGLAEMPNGDLIVAGSFTDVGGQSVNSIARWDGSSWSDLGGGVNNLVNALAVLPNGDLVAGGSFTTAGAVGANRIARWDGTMWSAFPTRWSLPVSSLLPLANGDLAVGGSPTDDGVAIWSGGAWSVPGTGIRGVASLDTAIALTELPNGELFVGGQFDGAGTLRAEHMAIWSGSSWRALAPGGGPDDAVFDVAERADGSFVLCGDFRHAGAGGADHVVQWDGQTWTPMGAGVNSTATAAIELPNGDVVVGGYFSMAGTQPVNGVARWDGSSWSAMGQGLPFAPEAFAIGPNGNLIAGGGVYQTMFMASWDGTSWSAVPGAPNNAIHAIATLPNGDLVLAGRFTMAGNAPANRVARWDGTNWSPYGIGLSGSFNSAVRSVTVLGNGDVFVGGRFRLTSSSLNISAAVWDGGQWNAAVGPIGPAGEINDVLALPGGDVLATGRFDRVPASLARWNGSSWGPVGAGLDWEGHCLHMTRTGEVLLAGDFSLANDEPAANVAWLSTTCPASVAVGSVTCLRPVPVLLLPDGLPWVGTTFESTASGFAPGAMAYWVMGFTPQQIPLPQIHPAGQSGCHLLTSTEAALIVPTAGQVRLQVPIPNNVALVNTVFLQQILHARFVQGALASLSSSNELTVRVGAF